MGSTRVGQMAAWAASRRLMCGDRQALFVCWVVNVIWHRTSALVVCPPVTVATPVAWHR